MKSKYIYLMSLMGGLALSSCSDQFLQDKDNYGQIGTVIYKEFDGANGRLSDVYALCLPDENLSPGGNTDINWKAISTGSADDWGGKSTEEYSGFSVLVDPQKELSYDGTGGTRVYDFFNGKAGNVRDNPWGRIRNCNDLITNVLASPLTQEEKDIILGQAYFLRAWCYYNMVKWYGGVPIITDVLEPEEGVFVPRSSTKECIDFICDDLDNAADMLWASTGNGGWQSAKDWGRVTSGTALALKGRVLLLWASPLFNRSDDATRWNEAYIFMQAALPKIESCGHGLAYEGDPGTNASNWAKMFTTTEVNKEAVFVKLNNTNASATTDYSKNSAWENGVRPSNAAGGGGKTPSAMLVDMFPMADGKRPATCTTYDYLTASELEYDSNVPFVNRDPRFYRTFAFPGVRWAFNGDPRNDSNNNPYNGKDYQLWNYVWYTSTDDAGNVESGNAYGADNLLKNAKGMYVRKRSDDLDVNSTPNYIFNTDGFKLSAVPYIEMRFAEVLLNYAEAACGAGHMDVAVAPLQRIRGRVGYTADNNYGLQSDLTSSKATCMSAILYERQIELAYEGKRFDDLRRWMLFDGGAGKVAGAPATWDLTGWGGNTCAWLGFDQLNGQRRENMEFRTKDDFGIGTDKFDGDPLVKAGVTRPSALDYRKDLAPQVEALKTFYQENLVRKQKRGDADDSDNNLLYIDFRPHYYILGLNDASQKSNPGLPQTIGWGDYYKVGSNGTFDPLALTVTE